MNELADPGPEQIERTIDRDLCRFLTAADAPSTWRLLGFRHVALVTINDTDSTAVAAAKDQDGTGALPLPLMPSSCLSPWPTQLAAILR